jgi:uncharacterized membrane protein
MTNPLTPEPAPLPPEPPEPPASGAGSARTSRWVKLVLAASLGLNLAVAGLALGAWTKDGRERGVPRGLSFGPFNEALSPDDRRALRHALMGRAQEIKGEQRAARADLVAVLTALRADPFVPAELSSSLAKVEARLAGRLTLGRSLIETRLQAMSEADRLAFADRLELTLGRRP